MENIDTRATAFGRELGAIMEARGIPAEPEEIRALAERSGFDGDAFLALATSEDAPDVGPLSGLDREMRRRDMELSGPERVALAEAYLFGRDDADEGNGRVADQEPFPKEGPGYPLGEPRPFW